MSSGSIMTKLLAVLAAVSTFGLSAQGSESCTSGGAWTVSGDHAFVACGFEGLQIIDVGTPSAPVAVAFLTMPGRTTDVAVSRGHAYVANGYSGLKVIDVSAPTRPVEVDCAETPGCAADAELDWTRICVTDPLTGRNGPSPAWINALVFD